MIIIYLFMAASILASLFILCACIAAARVERGPSTAEARRQQAHSVSPAPPSLKRALPSDFIP